jgi:hypothetical protein
MVLCGLVKLLTCKGVVSSSAASKVTKSATQAAAAMNVKYNVDLDRFMLVNTAVAPMAAGGYVCVI